MRKYFLIPIYIVLVIITLYSPVATCQTPSYTCTLMNDTLKSGNIYEFDVYLLRTGSTPLQLGGMQMGFTYNNAIKNGGTMTATWVGGSPDAAITASGQNNNNGNTVSNGIIKIAAVLAPQGPGTGANISATPPGTRIGRLRLTNSVPFLMQDMSLNWNFSTTAPNYPTKLSAYLPASSDGVNTDITVPASFVNNLKNPLPVELSSFTSRVNGRDILLSWETKTELNTYEFEITRTKLNTDASVTTWNTVGSIKASGTSTSPKNYTFKERDLQAGKYQYRLKMMDNDGTFQYSKVIETEIALPKEFSINQNYPNPFNPTTNIVYQLPVEAKVILEVFDLTGKKIVELVNQDQSAGYYSVNFGSLSNKLASGVYIYRISAIDKAGGNNFTSMKKMMLLK
jgi:hypothetical protein